MPLHPADVPTVDPAHLVTLADRCVQCGLCLPHCPTYRLDRLEAEGPRGRIAYAKAVAAGTLPATETGDRHLDHCLGCRRCEAVCPAGVRYEELLIGARTLQFERKKPGLGERATLAALASPALLRLALPAARLIGRLPAVPHAEPPPAPGVPVEDRQGAVTLFMGCAGRDYERGTRDALEALLDRAGVAMGIEPDERCCGTAAAHAGDAERAAALAAHNRAVFAMPYLKAPAQDARRTLLTLASGCQSILTASLAGAAEVEDALTFLDREGGRLAFRPARTKIALHLPCSQRVLHGAAALRRLLARIPELEVVELPDTGCCGAAGMHMLAEPARAATLRAPLVDAFLASGATGLLSANLGCRLHLGNAVSMPVRHPIDFLAEHLA